MRLFTAVAFAATALFSAISASAEENKVLESKEGCRYFVVESTKGFMFLKRQDGALPKKKDVLIGGHLDFGITHLTNTANQKVTWVFIENSWETKQEALNRYIKKCGPIKKPEPKPAPKPEPKPEPKPAT